MATPKIALPDEFLTQQGEPPIPWKTWLSTIDDFFFLNDRLVNANKRLDDKAKNLYICQFLGTEGRRVAMAYSFYEQRYTLKYEDFIKELTTLFEPKINQVKAAFDFRKRIQSESESVTSFINDIRSLINKCNYKNPELEKRLLAEQLVIGCKSKLTQEKLLAESEIDYEKFVRIMLADETASKDSKILQSKNTYNEIDRLVQSKSFPKNSSNLNNESTNKNQQSKNNNYCFGCGRNTHFHLDDRCPAKGKFCKICSKPNHFASVCLSKKSHPQNFRNNKEFKDREIRENTFSTTERREKMKISVGIQSCNSNFIPYNAFVDSGSDISTITTEIFQKLGKIKFDKIDTIIRNFDGTLIRKIFGTLNVKIRFRNKEAETKIYITENDLKPTIGTDLIQGLNLTITGKNLQISTINENNYLHEFPQLLSDKLGTFTGFKHKILLRPDFKPTEVKLRPIPYSRREATIKECQDMVETGIWSPINKSEWVHNLVSVPKPDGSVRITTDLSSLNKYIIPERHLIPNISDIFLELRGAKYFSKIDLKKGFFHIELDDESKALTSTITPAGLFAYNRLPMGLKDSASVFQKAVHSTLKSCENCQSYIDDIIIFGKSIEEHDKFLNKVLKCLNENNFRININKCIFLKPSINYLGHIISEYGIQPDPKNIEALEKIEEPRTIKQVQSFLGAVNFYTSFIPDLANLAEPLRALTRKGYKFKWTHTEITAFNSIKKAILNNNPLAIFDPNAKTYVTTDASEIGLGGMLSQVQNGKEVPVAYASHTLSPTQRNYSTGEKEALACLWACEHWEKYLLGRFFILRTDHSPLVTLLTKNTSLRQSAKFSRWLIRLSIFDYEVEYMKGENNKIADFLSRSPMKNCFDEILEEDSSIFLRNSFLEENISISNIHRHQREDENFKNIYNFIKTGWPSKNDLTPDLFPYFRVRDELSIDNNIIIRDERILIPPALREFILVKAHEGHPGIVRMKRQLRKFYWWPGQDSDVERYVKYCIPCQDSQKSHKTPSFPNETIPTPGKPWSKLAIDITGPFFNAPRHQRFIVCLIDYYSKFPEVLLTNSIKSETIIEWLKEIFARYGNPDIIVSDNGTYFTSNEFLKFLHSRDILHWRTPLYDPQRNGLVEVFNRYLKNGIQTFRRSRKNFYEGVQELLFNFRTTSPIENGKSPAELIFNRQPRVNFQPRKFQEGKKEVHEEKRNIFKIGDLVRTRLPHVPKGLSPFSSKVFKITEILGRSTYRLNDGKIWSLKNLINFKSQV